MGAILKLPLLDYLLRQNCPVSGRIDEFSSFDHLGGVAPQKEEGEEEGEGEGGGRTRSTL